MIPKEQLINIAMQAIELEGLGKLAGGHLIFAYNMEDEGVPTKESVDAYDRARLLLACGEHATTVIASAGAWR